MRYSLKIESRAKKDLQSLDFVVQKRIAKKLKFFLEQPDPLQFARKLIDTTGGDSRWRVGHYRLVFDVKGSVIMLLRVQHRKDIYRK